MPANNLHGGRKRKIPESYYEDIYDMYSSGLTVEQIHQKCREEWSLDVGERTVSKVIKDIRLIKMNQLNDYIGADTENVLERYEWLQGELEELAVASRKDKDFFLKVTDRLLHMYEFRLQFAQKVKPDQLNPSLSDNGKDELLRELKGQTVLQLMENSNTQNVEIPLEQLPVPSQLQPHTL